MLAKPTISSTEMFPVKWDRSLASEVIRQSGTDLNQCFRCGTCASGCPFIRAMDYPPV
jgi:heterodisulfide reductase subunit C